MKKRKKQSDIQRCIVDMTILDSSNFISPYCGNYPVLGSEAAAYLDNAVKNIPMKKDIVIHIKSNVLEEKEQNIYRMAIKNYYHNITQQIIRDVFRSTMVSCIMMVIGIAVIAVMLILAARDVNEIWDIVLEIIGWVFIWEAVDTFCFERHRFKQELKRADQLKNANIQFLSMTNDR